MTTLLRTESGLEFKVLFEEDSPPQLIDGKYHCVSSPYKIDNQAVTFMAKNGQEKTRITVIDTLDYTVVIPSYENKQSGPYFLRNRVSRFPRFRKSFHGLIVERKYLR